MVTSDLMAEAVEYQSGKGFADEVKFWLGLANGYQIYGNTLSKYGWWLDGKNENALQTAFRTAMHDIEMSKLETLCGYYMENKWLDWHCDKLEGSVCEILYDACASMTCPQPKECIVNIDGDAQCFCPSGLPANDQCGANCTGKTDGKHEIVNCSSAFVMCYGGNIYMYQQCPEGKVFASGSCIGQDERFDCKCEAMGGLFAHTTGSCIITNETGLNMIDSFAVCQDKALTDFGTGYAGRLAHVTNDAVATAVYHQGGYSASYKNWLGAKMGPNGYSGGGEFLDHYRWWLDPNNDNSVYQITMTNEDLVDVTGLNMDDPANEHCFYTYARIWSDSSCTVTSPTRAMCEIIGDDCMITTCMPPKVCIPDVNRKTHCFCLNEQAPCGSYCGNQCQNGGTCVNENATNYTCNCTDPYYGMNCEIYCNTSYPSLAWSTCSNNCDYGIQHRQKPTTLDRNKPPLEQCVTSYQFEFQTCQTQPCEIHTSIEYNECMVSNGFYSTAACYFVVQSNLSMSWSDARIKCQQEGGILAIIADTNKTLDAIYGYLLSKAPDLPVWISHKAVNDGSGIFPMTMVDESESLGFTAMNHYGGSGCFAIGHTLQNVQAHLYADFVANEGKKIKMLDGLTIEQGIESSAWMCGLRCRRSKLCLAHAFKNITGECQLYKVKEGLPMIITSGATMKYIYMIEYDTDWVLYNRIY